jgi:hypothetical protein
VKVEPSAQDLLDIARATIIAEIVPSLPESRRYAALMAANALAIAGRDLAAPATHAAEIARIAALLEDWTAAGDDARSLGEGTARLAARIREGRFDTGAPRTGLLAHLRETTRMRLAVSNPKVLTR